jgi:SprB repeat
VIGHVDRICTKPGSITLKNILSSSDEVVVNVAKPGPIVVVGSDFDGNFSKSDRIFDLPDGTYIVQIQPRGSIGCSQTSANEIIGIQQQTNSLTVIPTPFSPLCNNDKGSISMTISGATGAVDYSLDNFATMVSNPATGLAPNAYTIYARDINGCRETILPTRPTATIANPPLLALPTASVTSGTLPNHNGRDISCIGANNGQVTVTSSGGTGALLYSLDNGLTYPPNGGTFGNLPPGTYPYKVKDANGCTKDGTATIPITNPPALVPGTATFTNPLCASGLGTITVSGSGGGTGTLQYSRDGTAAFQAGGVLNNVPAGIYNNITVFATAARPLRTALP